MPVRWPHLAGIWSLAAYAPREAYPDSASGSRGCGAPFAGQRQLGQKIADCCSTADLRTTDGIADLHAEELSRRDRSGDRGAGEGGSGGGFGSAGAMDRIRMAPGLLLLLLGWMAVAQARFVVEENSITVASPASAAKKSYNSAIGNFGVPHYGGTMLGNVIYPGDNAMGCVPFSTNFKSSTPGALPTILLTDRGDCFFAKKVWNAQQAGAAAVLVADDRPELLITMDQPDADADAFTYLQNITIPSALIEKSFGDQLKKWLADRTEMVTLNLDWRESLPHPDNRVEYELWTNSNDQCGPKCDNIMGFLKEFKGAAEILEQGSYVEFTPHYITWYCPQAFLFSKQCKAQCINNGRYCAPDPEQDFTIGYDGKDVVTENLRQLCVFKVGKEKLQKPWVWWDYVTDFQIRCPMKEQKYNKACAEEVIKSLGLPLDDINRCIGDPEANLDNEVLQKEQDAQVGEGERGDVTILPTLVINQRQYRGKLEKTAVLKAICSGFQEATEPAICLNEDMETNECLVNNGGCWQNTKQNITACKDTFRGRICQCPAVGGVQFQGDGYSSCEPIGTGRCTIDNGGCWKETKDSVTFSACSDMKLQGCECPSGFKGDGVNSCVDIDECSEKTACTCPQCSCKNTWGSYDCSCLGSPYLLYIREHDTCISKSEQVSRVGWVVTLIVFGALAVVGVSGYVVYKYRLRSYMDSEIRAIMAQYMPLDSQGDVHQHLTEEDRI